MQIGFFIVFTSLFSCPLINCMDNGAKNTNLEKAEKLLAGSINNSISNDLYDTYKAQGRKKAEESRSKIDKILNDVSDAIDFSNFHTDAQQEPEKTKQVERTNLVLAKINSTRIAMEKSMKKAAFNLSMDVYWGLKQAKNQSIPAVYCAKHMYNMLFNLTRVEGLLEISRCRSLASDMNNTLVAINEILDKLDTDAPAKYVAPYKKAFQLMSKCLDAIETAIRETDEDIISQAGKIFEDGKNHVKEMEIHGQTMLKALEEKGFRSGLFRQWDMREEHKEAQKAMRKLVKGIGMVYGEDEKLKKMSSELYKMIEETKDKYLGEWNRRTGTENPARIAGQWMVNIIAIIIFLM